MPSPPTCSITARTCASCRCSSATPTLRRRRSTRTLRGSASSSCMRGTTRAANGARQGALAGGLGSLAAFDDDAEPLDAGHGRELGDADPDPWRAELGPQQLGQRLGKALEQLVRMIGSKCLDAPDDGRVIERVGEIVAGEGLY